MKTKDIPDLEVLEAYNESKKMEFGSRKFPDQLLQEKFNYPEKVIFSAMIRTYKKGLIDYGVSLRSGWLTQKGLELLKNT